MGVACAFRVGMIYRAMWGASEFNCTGNLASYDRSGDLRRLAVPVLFLCGEHDEVRQETLERYLMGSPRGSKLHVFQGSAHNTYLESTDAFIANANEFLRCIEP